MTKNEEFDKIYEQYKEMVLKAAYLYSGDLELAQDVMQDTFLILYKEMDKEDDPEKFTNLKAWLYTTAKHQALNHTKKHSRELYTGLGHGGEMEQSDSVRGSTEEEYFDIRKKEEESELHERIFSDLAQKNPRWYEAVMLTCYREIPQVKAAKMMGISEDAFYILLHRARNWIRKTYGAEYEELNRS